MILYNIIYIAKPPLPTERNDLSRSCLRPPDSQPMLALESQSRMTRRELLMTSISLVKDQVVLFLEMRPLCPVFEHGHLAFRWGKKPAARDSKPAEMARLDRTPTLHPSSANSTDPWQQRLKTGGARSSWQTYVGDFPVPVWRIDPTPVGSESWDDMKQFRKAACPLQSMNCTELYWCHFRVLRLHLAWATKREKDCAPLIIPISVFRIQTVKISWICA